MIAAVSVSFLLATRRTAAATISLALSCLLYAGWAAMWLTGTTRISISANDVVVHPWAWLPYTAPVT